MKTLMPEIPQTEVSALELELGVLTINQTAAQLAKFFTGDPVLQTLRLICRGSLPAVPVAGEPRVPVEALKSFLVNGPANAAARKALGVPAETVAPLFPWAGPWFDSTKWDFPIGNMITGLQAEVAKQLPATADDVTALATRLKVDPRGDVNVGAQVTPLMASLIQGPAPAAGGVFDMPDASMFLNVGEIYLCQRLQAAAARIIHDEAVADYANIKPEGFGPLYTPANYTRIVNAALNSDIRGGAGASKLYSPLALYGSGRMASVALTDAQIRVIAGTTPERLAALAF